MPRDEDSPGAKRTDGRRARPRRPRRQRNVSMLPQLLSAAVEVDPNHDAVVSGSRTLSYSELDRRSSRLARLLIAHGAGPEAVVAIGITRSIESVLSLWAVTKTGAAFVPVDPNYPVGRVHHMLTDSGARIGITTAQFVDQLPDDCTWIVLDDAAVESSLDAMSEEKIAVSDRLSPLRADNPAYVIYTSGSTGLPKGVVVTHSGLADLATEQRERYGTTSSSRTLHFASPSFDASILELLLAVAASSTMIIAPTDIFGGEELADLLRRESITHAFVTPAALASVDNVDLPTLDVVVVGGEACPPELVDAWGGDHRFFDAYGPTESTVASNISNALVPGNPVSIGDAIAGTTAHVLDRRLRPVPAGVAGELYLSGAGLARGYRGKPGLTAERFVANPFGAEQTRMYRTGDVVRRNSANSLQFVERNDQQVKVRGFRIELGEIDSALSTHPSVQFAVTVGYPGADGDTVLASYVRPATSSSPDTAELSDYVGKTLPRHMIPSAIMIIDEVPLTPSGKLDRDKLPAPVFAAREYRRPETESEVVVARVFSEILGVEQVGLDDDFFELGGNSLSATRLAARIGAALDVNFGAREVFVDSTVAGLAAAAAGKVGGERRVALGGIPRPERVPLSLAQQRMWFLNRFDTESAAYNIPVAIRLSGALDVSALGAAVGDVVARHEPLRTIYPYDMDGPVQRVLGPESVVDMVTVDVTEEQILAEVHALASTAFDVTVEVPVRVRLYRVSDVEFVLALVVQHISADGGSMGPLTRDLMVAYAARVSGQVPAWSPLEVQYADYAVWQREVLGSEVDPSSVAHEQISFWKSELAGLPDQIDLPTDRPRPAVQSLAGGKVDFSVDPAVQSGLMRIARESNATLFMAVHAAWAALLSRLSGSSDVVVGSPIAGRGEAALDDVIGMFANTLVFRTVVDAAASFEQLVATVRENDVRALANADVPFERLVEVLNPARSTARHPLFQVGLSFQNLDKIEFHLPDLAVAVVDADAEVAQFDLHLIVSDQYDDAGNPSGIGGTLKFATSLFDEVSAKRIVDRFVGLLSAVVVDASRPVGDVDVVGSVELGVLGSWNETSRVVDSGATLVSLFESSVVGAADSVAVVFGSGSWTYGEFGSRVNRLARYLVSVGVGPESLVVVAMRRSESLVVAMYAVVVAGGAYVPVDPDQPVERMGLVFESARPVVVLVAGRDGGVVVPDVGAVVVDVESVDVSSFGGGVVSDAERVGRLRPDNAAYVIFTSGSTGRPKGVAVSHRAVVNQLEWKRFEYGLDGSDVSLLKTAATFDLSVWELWSWVGVGGRVVVASADGHRDPAYLSELIERESVTTLHVVPSVLGAAVAASGGSLPVSVRRVLAIGEALPVSTAESVLRGGGEVRLDNVYGPTEAAVSVTSNRVVLPLGSSVPIGRPEWNSRVFVLDSRLHRVPVGVVGELYLAGVQLARGYQGRVDLTAERFVADPFAGDGSRLYRTGDVVRWTGDGVLDYVGRSDFQVKVRGFRIELGEIESVLGGVVGVRDAVVVARGDDRLGDRLVAYVVGEEGVSLDVGVLKGVVSDRLPSYMVPSVFVVLDALPLTVNGKLDRGALPEPEFEARVFRAPSSSVEEAVAGVFADVLGVPRVGLDDDFFELGGNSLIATQVVARLGVALDAQIPVRVLFEVSSVEALAARVESQVGSGARAALVAGVRPDRIPLSLAQQRMWFLNRFDPESAAYNIPVAIRLSGALDVSALGSAVGDVVARHESLRTVYPEVEGAPVQRIVSVADAGVRVVVIDVAADEVVSVVGSLAVQPFDVTAEVPVRVRLYRVSDVEFVLALVVQHISADGGSMGPLTRDLMVAYAARVSGQVPAWSPLEVQYADYAVWQREVLGSEVDPSSVAHEQISFWKSELAGLPDQIDLPTDRPRPAVQSLAGGKVDFSVDPAVQSGLMRIARESNATLFMAVHAAWAALLSRLSGSSDVVVGSPIAGRGEAALDDVIGMFANTLVLRSVVDPASSFVELLDSVRESDLRAFAHADVPFERLVEVLNPARSTARHPLFQVALSFQNVQSTALELPSLSVAGVDADLNISQFDLHLVVSDTYDEDGAPAGLGMSLTYMSSLFDEVTARTIAERLVMFLSFVEAEPSRPVGDVDVVGSVELGVLGSWNETSRVVDSGATLVSLFESSVVGAADSVAVVFGSGSWTYGEFGSRVNRLARYLVSVGVGPESLVVVAMRRSESLVVAMYAVVVAGGAYVPVDPDQPVERMGLVFESARPVVVLVAGRDGGVVVPDVGAVVVDVESVDVSSFGGGVVSDAERVGRLRPDNAAYVIFTSGSTGRPKGVAVSHRAVVNQLEWKRFEYGLDGSDVSLLKTAATFDLSVWELWSWVGVGGRVVVASADGHRDPAYLSELIERESVTTLHVVPSVLGAVVAASGGSLPVSVRRVLAIGEALPVSTAESVLRGGGEVRLDNVYGPTEAAVSVTSNRVVLPLGSSVPIGRPEWNSRVFVLDSRLHRVPVGVVGELYLAGVQLARGYQGRVDLTAERFVADPFAGDGSRLYRTGDVVRWTGDGVLDYVGRSDFQVKVRGFRIELGEIESVLGGVVGVRDAVVVARGDDRLGDRLVAYVVGEEGVSLDVGVLKGVVSDRLPSYMVPSVFVVLDALPLTVNGKLDRGALPEPEFEARVFRAPSSSVEEAVAGVFADVLGVPRVGLDDDFFELGGNSLIATQVVARLGVALDAQIPVRVLFEVSSVEALAARVESQVGSGARAALVAGVRPDRIPLSLAQQRMWFLNRFDPESAAYNIPVAIRLSGALDVSALGSAVGDVVARHESLRTVYPEVEVRRFSGLCRLPMRVFGWW
ncbi:amino acid adenylation domain-containing protein [Rhodococcus sp. P1Y]|uniref:non-ribosomal peptide synthetase n=1 Tax=Rhodococcus sp. P1Y TaxID=1302308 RepID=UPI003FA77EDD